MKQKDIALIVVIIVISTIVSIFVSNAVFGGKSSKNQTVETVPKITSTFETNNSPNYFQNGYDPTQLIQIGPNNNTNPFKASSN